MSARAATLLLALALAGAACMATTQRREDVLVQNARAFNDDWRWGRWNSMAGAMPAADGKAFLARVAPLENELVVADFEVTSIDFVEASDAANVVARFEWYLKRDPTLRNTTVEQHWRHKDGRWQMTKLRRTRGDRFGLVTEPVAGAAPEDLGATAEPSAPRQ